jgi:hypothetical protein
MIQVKFDSFWSTLLIGLFLVLLALKLSVAPNLLWTVVGLPIYGPPIISLAVALIKLHQHRKHMRGWF